MQAPSEIIRIGPDVAKNGAVGDHLGVMNAGSCEMLTCISIATLGLAHDQGWRPNPRLRGCLFPENGKAPNRPTSGLLEGACIRFAEQAIKDDKMNMKISLTTFAAGLVLATSAYGQTTATAYTDLNLRSGPGPTYSILAVIPAQGTVTVEGCLEVSNWCQVTHDGVSGWSSGDYLTAMIEAPIYANRERLAVNTVTYDATTTTTTSTGGTVAGGATGAIAGAIVGGPIGAVIGAAIGMGVGSAVTPDERVTTYVRTNPVDPIYLDGEIVVGAGIPETVTLSEVPESEYYYAYVNGVPVLVERQNRRVVYIVR